MKSVYLFDVDGTICESGQKISPNMIDVLSKLHVNHELGVVGGGTIEKLKYQLDTCSNIFQYMFAECGSVAYINDKLVHKNNIRQHKLFPHMQKLMKISLKFIAEQDYPISGHFIDLRNGLIYISLVGLQATLPEREQFIKLDQEHKYREKLYKLLHANNIAGISINYGGQVGIGIYPAEWDKAQVVNYFPDDNYKIHYFGDKYNVDGNDYTIIHHSRVIGHKVNTPDETMKLLNSN